MLLAGRPTTLRRSTVMSLASWMKATRMPTRVCASQGKQQAAGGVTEAVSVATAAKTERRSDGRMGVGVAPAASLTVAVGETKEYDGDDVVDVHHEVVLA